MSSDEFRIFNMLAIFLFLYKKRLTYNQYVTKKHKNNLVEKIFLSVQKRALGNEVQCTNLKRSEFLTDK